MLIGIIRFLPYQETTTPPTTTNGGGRRCRSGGVDRGFRHDEYGRLGPSTSRNNDHETVVILASSDNRRKDHNAATAPVLRY